MDSTGCPSSFTSSTRMPCTLSPLRNSPFSSAGTSRRPFFPPPMFTQTPLALIVVTTPSTRSPGSSCISSGSSSLTSFSSFSSGSATSSTLGCDFAFGTLAGSFNSGRSLALGLGSRSAFFCFGASALGSFVSLSASAISVARETISGSAMAPSTSSMIKRTRRFSRSTVATQRSRRTCPRISWLPMKRGSWSFPWQASQPTLMKMPNWFLVSTTPFK
mmetsp:Transcript_89320/g.213339  ORF Transcript_89320/g.213339 Transcript_89320/m.213339 type:complete len:218 (+) Transcript_89320:236-889(+)